jgi:transcriptional regulator with XRE-family HTH domain
MARLSLDDFNPRAFKALRVKAGMSITDLSRATKISRAAISKWEHGKSNPSPENFLIAMKALDANPDIVVPDKGQESTLFDLRTRAGKTRRQIYEALGIARSTWGDIERGNARLPAKRVAPLAQVLEVSEELVEQAARNTSLFK